MKILLVLSILSFLLGLIPVVSHAADELTNAVVYKKTRPYPGGVDEEDLKVQESMKSPTATVDRRGIESRVLKSYFKKAEEETDSAKKSE